MSTQAVYLVGCCGFPKARAVYYRTFPAVEVQSTFYRLPRETTAQRWREQAPPGFVFTMKAWQMITHPPGSPTYRRAPAPQTQEPYGFFRSATPVMQAWEATRRIALTLQAQVVLFQCPPAFTPTQEHVRNMRVFFQTIPRGPFHLAWEPRGTWPTDLVLDLCRELDLLPVLDPLEKPPLPGEVAYFRLHGRPLGGGRYHYHHQYSLDQLVLLRERVLGFSRAYVFFNNTHMWEDARRFLELLASGSGSTRSKRPMADPQV